METSHNPGNTILVSRLLKKIVTFSLFAFLLLNKSLAQPTWVTPYPEVSDITAVNGNLNVTLTGLTGNVTVYYVYWRYPASGTPETIKAWSAGPFDGNMLGGGSFTYSLSDNGNLITTFFDNLLPNRPSNTMLVTVEYSSGNFLATKIISFPTPACPSIFVESGFVNDDRCVNGDGANKLYTISTFDGYNGRYSNVLSGASWRIDWGDGSEALTYTSQYNNDGPGDVLVPGWENIAMPHTYTFHDTCVMVATLTITNPAGCATIGGLTETKDVLLAGRDWHEDGNGYQLLVNDDNGSPDTIKVCEGTEAFIRLRDNGVWDCDETFKTYPPGEPNLGDRHVQFVYGMNPVSQSVENTITGDVLITGSYPGTANTSAGHASDVIHISTTDMDPVTNPHTRSDLIRIPPTAVFKEKMHVYFKNWNKCNPYNGSSNTWDGTAVWDSIVIYIVKAPPAPVVEDPTYCYGDSPVIDPISSPVGVFRWYDSDMNFITTGNTYTPNVSAPGSYTYYVTDQELTGHQCESPATEVTLTIRENLTLSGPISGDTEVCPNETGLIYSIAGAPPVMTYGGATRYVWSVVNGTITSSNTGNSVTVTAGSNPNIDMSVSVRLEYTTSPSCPSGNVTLVVDINPVPVGSNTTTSVVCSGTVLNINPQSQGSVNVPGSSFIWTGNNSSSGSGNITDSPVNTSTSRINVVYTVYPTGPNPSACPGDFFTITVPVDPETNPGTLAHGAGQDTICRGSSVNLTVSGYVGNIKRYRTRRLPSSTWTAYNSSSSSRTFTPSSAGTWEYQVRVQSGVCPEIWGNVVTVVVNPPTVAGSVGESKTVCQGENSGELTLSGQTGDVLRWQVSSNNGSSWSDIPNTTTTYTSGQLNVPGTYWYRAEVKSGKCNALFSSHAAITVSPATVAGEVTGGTNVCNGVKPSQLTLISYTGSILRWEYSYNGGAYQAITNTNPTYDPPATTTAGTYVYRAVVKSGACDELRSSTTTIVVNQPFTVNASVTDSDGTNDGIVCEDGQFTFNSSIVNPGAGGPYVYTWSNGTGDTFTGEADGTTIHQPPVGTHTYTLTVRDNFSPTCEAVANVTVTRLDNPSVNISPAGSPVICVNSNLNLTGNALAGTRPLASTIWSGDVAPLNAVNVDEVVFNTGTPGLYSLTYTVTDNYGCTVTESKNINVRGPVVTINEGESAGVCLGNDLSLSTTESFSGGTFSSRIWTGRYDSDGAGPMAPVELTAGQMGNLLSPGAASQNPVFNTTGSGLGTGVYQLTVTVTDNNSCSASDVILINVSQVTANITSDLSVCEGAELIINGNPSGGTGDYPVNTWTRVTSGTWSLTPNGDATTATMLVPSNIVSGSAIYALRYYVEDADGCSFQSPAYNVTVYEVPDADAGPEDYICVDISGVSDYTLAAIPSVGIGTWTVISSPPGSSVSFSNANSAVSSVNVDRYGDYTLRWTEVNGSICSDYDDVVLHFAEEADAGPEQFRCATLTAASFSANNPSTGTGTWTYTGPGSVVNWGAGKTANDFDAQPTVSLYGDYTFTWTIQNGPTMGGCNTSDDVLIHFAEQAEAGPEQFICATLTAASFSANNPSTGTGTWTYTGPGSVVNWGVGKTANDFDAQPTVSLYGDYTFTWTIQNGPTMGGCNTSDNVLVHFTEEADAGPEQFRCATLTVTLAGNDPSTGTGTWTYTGPGSVVNWGVGKTANDFDVQPTVSLYGDYTFTWTIQNGPTMGGCNTSDDVLIHFAEQAEAGPEQFICATLTAASFSANNPSTGTGTWTYTGPGSVVNWGVGKTANDFDAQPTVSLYGDYTFTWTIQNGPTMGGCNTSDNVLVHFAEEADAGPEQYRCATLTVTLAGNDPSTGTGTWTYTGPGSVVNWGVGKTANDFDVQPTVSLYGDYTFTWTIQNGPVLSGCNTSDNVQIHFAEEADAGPEQYRCATLTVTLAGNDPSTGTGTWTYTGPGNVLNWGAGKTANDFDAQPTVSLYGDYTFTWTIQNGPVLSGCSTSDNVQIHFAEQAEAGPEQFICATLTAASFSANDPSTGTGTWTYTGPGSVVNWGVGKTANDFDVQPTVSLYGDYTFTWTIQNGPVLSGCNTSDNVQIHFAEEADAGSEQFICAMRTVTLAGNKPSAGTGTWSYTGPGVVSNWGIGKTPADFDAQPTVSLYGDYTFTWTIQNGPVLSGCSTSDDVQIHFAEQAEAGPEQFICATLTAASFNANVPSTGSGSWTYSGPGNVVDWGTNKDEYDFDITPTVSAYGNYTFTWTIQNGPTMGGCSTSNDVLIHFAEHADAGNDQHVDCNLLTTTLAGNNPSAGIGTWSLTGVNPGNITGWGSTNANTFNGTPVVSAYGTYTFRWTIVNGPVPGNGCSTYDDVEITFYPEHTVATIADFSVCRDSSLTPISITGSFGGGALSASWSVTTGNGYVQNESIAGNTVTAEYVPVYSDITAGGVVLTLTTNSPAVNETCSAVSDNLNVTIDEAVYVVIDQAPLLIIAEGTSAVITATISGARGTVTTGTWTEQGALTGGDFSPGITSNNITFTPTPAQEAAGSVVLRLTSANPGTTCSPAFAEITILIGANPVADAGPDIETCEPADSLLHLSGYAKASANDANWSVLPGGFGTIISQTKTWSSPQSTPHDENDSLLVEAVYRLHPSDYGTPSTGSSFGFRLTTDDPDGAGPVSDDYDDMTYTVHWSPKTPPVGGGGRTVTCVNSMGNYYAVPLNTGNTYAWEIEVLTGNGVPGTDYLVAQGGTGYNYIVIHWYNEGTYNLKVTETTYLTDGTPCVGETVIQPIGVYSQPLVTAGRDTTLCIGGSAGLSSSVTGGSGSYLYEWSPSIGLSAFNIPNPVVTGTYLGDVVYTVKVTDLISGCQSSTATVTITTVPLPDIFTLSGNAFYCYGSAEGATLTLSGSETNVLYQLMNGATAVGTPRSGTGDTLQWKNNFDGSYFVEAVRNATPACERTMAGIVNITANPEIVMTVNQIVNTNCYGSDEGRISISVTGGTAPYTYLWSGPASFSSTNEDISSLYAGDYFVEVTDSRGCKFMSSAITVSQPDELVIASVNEIQAVTCYGGSDGSAEVTMEPGTGTPPYTYQWFYNAALSSPVVPEAVSSVLSGVPAGTYYVLVMDNNLCTVTGSVTISQPDQITGSVQLVTPVSCNGESDAVIQVTASGGSGSFEFDLNGEGTWANTDGLFSGLGRGSYTLRVRDANATVCVVNLPDVAITEPAVLTISASVTSNYNGAQISCTSADDGIITVSGSGGTAPYVFNIDGGDFAAGTTFVGLSAGSHTVGIRDARGCTDYTDINISSPDPVTGTASAVSDFNGYNVRCNGGADGVIEVIASGGTGTLRYSRDGTAFQLSNTFTGLTAGLYDITVRDANMCTFLIEDVEVTEPDELTASASVTTDFHGFGVSCFGAADGVVTASATGGAGTYLYRWYYNAALTLAVPGGNADVLSSLPTGTYYVRVTDANGCTASAEVTVTGPPELVITRSADVTLACNGDANGTGSFSVTGGTGVYTIVADVNGTGAVTVPGPSGLTFTGASGGVVSITVTDENDCSKTSSITINEPLPITASAEVTSNYNGSQLSCYGASDGRITVTAMGGTGNLSYVLTSDPSNVTGAESGVFTGLTAGVYNFIVSDVNGCEVPVGPVTITPPPQLEIVVNVISDFNGRDISCYGASDGRAEAVVTGGTGSYTYTWYRDPGLSNPLGQLTPVASNLIAGDYYVRARDINGCTIDGSVTLSQPRALAASVSDQENVDCFSAATGSVTVEANDTTGTAPYYYSIDGGSTWKDDGFFGNLTAMPYTVLVRDANDCVITVPFTITQPSQLVATVTALTHVSCNGGSNGSVTITPSAGSGTAPYRFSLNGEPAVASGVFSGLTAGSYVVTVIDDNDCSIDIPVMISEPPVLELNPTADVTLDCYGDRTGTGTFYAVGGTPNYSFAYDPADNTAGATFAAPGYNTQTIYNAGAGSVTVTVTDSKGCTATATISFTQPDSLTAGSITGDQVLCYGEDPGIISEADAPTGGPAPFDYRFQWQQSNSPTGIFINIPNATGPDYDPNPVNGATTTLYYRRMLTSGSCPPVYSNTVEVLVHPRPIARLRGGGSICPGDTAYLFVEMLAGMGPFTVDINGLTGPLTGYNSGDTIRVMPSATTTYNLLSVTDANMCTSSGPPNISGNATVTVYDLPQITSFTPSPAVCEFEYTTFSATATPAAVIYQWYVIDSTGVRALSDDNTYYGTNMPNLFIFNTTRWMNGNIYYVTASGCGAEDVSAQGVLTVNAAPEITLHPSDTVICLGQSAVMQADATAVQGLEWTWFVNRGSGLEIVHDEAPFSGSTTNTLTITSPPHTVSPWTFRAMARGVCGVPVYTHFASMRVINPPYFISQPASDAICENGSTYFRADARDFNTVNWQVNNGSGWMNLADDINHIGSTSQQLNVLNAPIALDGYRYRLALVSICDTVYSDPVTLTVHTNPVVDFSAIDPLAACGGVPLVIEGNPTGGSGIWSQHRWTGDVGPLNNYFIESPVFNVSITGNYNLTYRVTDSHGCYAEDNLTVIVDSPSALFSQNVDFGCTPLPVTFSKDMSEVAKWWWDFGDGSPLDSINAMPEHIFENSNTGSIEYFRVTLKVQSPGGCFAEYSSMITVYPEINASITPDKDIVCSGNSITFVADQGAKTYYWDFGDGAAGNGQSTMSHRYVNTDTVPVVYTVRLTTTSFYDCVDVAVYDITVMPVPGPQFSADPVMQVYDAAGNDVRFENTSAPGQWNWLWRFGDNTTSTERDPVHTYTDLGTYPVTLVAYNAVCRDSITREIRVVPPQPVAMFEDIPSGCAPWYIKPVNISENIDIPGTKFYWSFGDGSTSTAREPDYTYFTAGDYTVELYIEGPGGTSSYSQRVSAYPSPKAYFEITPERVYVNDERVRCFNLSQGAEWYIWDFGDGDTSKLKEPYHRYMTEGVYDITLWAHSSNGCTDKYILSPAVTVEPVGELRFASVFTPNKTGPVERTDLPTGGVEIDQFFYPSIRERVLEYKLQIFNRWGVLIFESHDINVPWNGYYNNELCPQGVYVWYVEGKYLDGKPFRQAGDVTLLH